MNSDFLTTIVIIAIGALIVLLGLNRYIKNHTRKREEYQRAEQESFERTLSEIYNMLEQHLNGLTDNNGNPVKISLDRTTAAAPFFIIGNWPKEYGSLSWLPGQGEWWATYQGDETFLDIITTASASSATGLLISTYRRKQLTRAANAALETLARESRKAGDAMAQAGIGMAKAASRMRPESYRSASNNAVPTAQQTDTSNLLMTAAVLPLVIDENAENDRIVEEILEAKREREEATHCEPEPSRYEPPASTYESPSYDTSSSSSSSSYDSGSSSSSSSSCD